MDVCTIAKNANAIFSMPEVAFQINKLIQEGDAKNQKLEEIIRHDPTLTANILKFANSAYFGFSGEIDTISRAITLIGHKQLHNLVLATSVTETFDGISSDLVDMETFWYHSVISGVSAKLISTHLKKSDRERFFIAGLLHGIGKLILYSQLPDESVQVLTYKQNQKTQLIDAERKILGFTHAELGAEFLKQWQLPPSIWKLIKYQVEPFKNSEYKDDACIMHIATHITNCIQPNAKLTIDLDQLKQPGIPEAWQHTGLDDDFVVSITGDIDLQASEILSIIKPQT